jgi:recombination protein RecT
MEQGTPSNLPAKPIDRFKQEIVLRKESVMNRLPQHYSWDRYQGIVEGAVMNNMDLLECDRASLLLACLDAAALGLDLNKSMAEADILKVWNNKTKRYEAQFRPRYKGLMKLALQTGEVLKIESRIVYENDDFEIIEGTTGSIVHKRKLSGRGGMIGAYCVWTLRNGETQFEVMSKEEIHAIRDRSSSKTKEGKVVGPWVTDEAEMWRKTVVRRATKYMPMSPDAARAVHKDNVAEGVFEADDYDGDAFDVTDFEEVQVVTEDEPEPAAEKVSTLEEKLTKVRSAEPTQHIEIEVLECDVDEDGIPDWDTWGENAISIVSSLDLAVRKQWRKVHASMMDEAELMSPNAVNKLLKLFN